MTLAHLLSVIEPGIEPFSSLVQLGLVVASLHGFLPSQEDMGRGGEWNARGKSI